MSGDSFDSRRGRGLDDVFFDDDEGGYGVDALRASLPTPRRGGGGASLGGFTGGVPPPGGPGPGAAQRAAMERALAARASSAAAPPLGRPPGQGQPAGAAGEAQRAAMRRALAARAAAAPPLEADRFLSDPSSAAAEPVDSTLRYLPQLGGQGRRLRDPSGDEHMCLYCMGAVYGPLKKGGVEAAAGTAHLQFRDTSIIPQLLYLSG